MMRAVGLRDVAWNRARSWIACVVLCVLVACGGESIIAPPITPVLGVTTTSLTVSASQGDSIAQSLTVTGETPTTWSATTNVPWISVSPSSGTTPSTVTVDTKTSGLSVGSHSGTVTIQSPGSAPVTVVVTLTVTAPTLTLGSAALSFSGVAGSSSLLPQTIAIGTGGSTTLQWSAAGNASWITVSPSSGTGAGNVSVGVNAATLTVGTYQGVVTVTALGAPNSPQTIPVSVVLSSPPTVNVTTTSSPVAGGTTSGAGTFATGTSVSVTALATAGWTFTNWTLNGAIVSTNRFYTFTANSNTALVANFTANPADVVVTPVASPVVAGSVAGGGNYAAGVEVTLNATPAAGYGFVNWTVNGNEVAINPQYGFTATASVSPVAHFIAIAPPGISIINTLTFPTNGGTVTGGGSYVFGTTVTLVATPTSGFVFSGWREIGNITPIVSTNATYTFPAIDRTLQAEFNPAPNAFTVTTTSNPATGGTMTGAGTYSTNADVWVGATANPGYTFTNWTRNGVIVSTSPTYFMLSPGANLPPGGSVALVANFSANQAGSFTITTSSSPAAGGTTTGTGSYASGASVTVTATAAPGYAFTNWTLNGSVVSASASYTFAASGNTDLVAHFTVPASFTVTTSSNPSAGGTTSGAGSYAPGAIVTVTATPASGYTFTGWTKNGVNAATTATYSFPATIDAALVASFVPSAVRITTSANPAAGGSISGGGTVQVGTSVTVNAVAAASYNFQSWTEHGTVVSTSASYTFSATVDRDLVANFVVGPTVVLTTSGTPAVGGTVTGGGTYPTNTDVTITATPAPGYAFVKWIINGHDAWVIPSFVHRATVNATIVAQFTAVAPPALSVITTEVAPDFGGTVAGGGSYVFGSTVTLVATPAPGYAFEAWMQITTITPIVSRNPTYTVIANSDMLFRAIFNALPPVTVTTVANPSAGGSTTGGGSYANASSVTVTATPASGYAFVSWTLNGTLVSTSPAYTFTPSANAALVANFTAVAPGNVAIATSSSPPTGGTTSGGGSYSSGNSVTVTATPATNYTFTNWTLNGTVVSPNSTYTFAASVNANLVANFTAVPGFVVTTTGNPVDGGYVVGGGTYPPGTTVTVSAPPNTGYDFANWSINGAVISTSVNYSFQVTGPTDLVATFARSAGYVVTVSAQPSAGGTVTGAGIYFYKQSATVQAAANSGWRFVNWKTSNGATVSTSPTYGIIVEGNWDLTATFDPICGINYTVSATANPSAGGTVTGGGVYASCATASLTATPSAGYTFTNWTQNGVVVWTGATFSFPVYGNTPLVANFTAGP